MEAYFPTRLSDVECSITTLSSSVYRSRHIAALFPARVSDKMSVQDGSGSPSKSTPVSETVKGAAATATSTGPSEHDNASAEAASDKPKAEVDQAKEALESPVIPASSSSPPAAPVTPASPAPRRPKPPTKGILKPPPPPARPTLSNRLRDFAGAAKSLFDPMEDDQPASAHVNGHGHGPASPHASSSSMGESSNGASSPSVTSAFSAFSGRLGAGFNRLVVAASQASAGSPTASPQGSPMGIKSISLPDGVAPLLQPSEKARRKQPLKRATFVLPSLSITYPISSQGEPWSQKVIEERDKVSHPQTRHGTSILVTDRVRSSPVIVLYSSALPVPSFGRMPNWSSCTKTLVEGGKSAQEWPLSEHWRFVFSQLPLCLSLIKPSFFRLPHALDTYTSPSDHPTDPPRRHTRPRRLWNNL